ncbi:hypothetical protein MJO28_008240 [Puccinia striiformis f. sp. tritici]|uniref:Uncharacterized protein n=1 Tax=Puccinia striiformis f. sp. tritici TaxID=168172 RepID=A0ACC0EAD0_9BASI|nr:hypothetical protein MJO28_008240 [Puccinia striiformis f. sp. tritici]KAI7952521.1 hypothetical protein MJO29_008152 [Puccinia striiformis f. sp. tritici]
MEKRKEHRGDGISIITNENAWLDSNYAGRNTIKLDLLPEISKEINLEREQKTSQNKSHQRRDELDKNLEETTHQFLIHRARTE